MKTKLISFEGNEIELKEELSRLREQGTGVIEVLQEDNKYTLVCPIEENIIESVKNDNKVFSNDKLMNEVLTIVNSQTDKLKNFIKRMDILNCNDTIDRVEVDIYKEGLYLHMKSCRNKISIFVDNNCKVIRKPINIVKIEKNTYWDVNFQIQ